VSTILATLTNNRGEKITSEQKTVLDKKQRTIEISQKTSGKDKVLSKFHMNGHLAPEPFNGNSNSIYFHTVPLID
jgi:hypothetical protein